MNIVWKSERLRLSANKFEAKKTDVISAGQAKQIYQNVSATFDPAADAVFIRRLPITLRPLDPENPEHGYVSDDPPDANEVWWITRCSFVESVALAIRYFDAPRSASCVDPNFDRMDIIRFLQSLPHSDALTLGFVDEGFLGFRYAEHTLSFDRKCLKRVMQYKAEHFRWESDSDDESWAWKTFEEDRSFTIGSV